MVVDPGDSSASGIAVDDVATADRWPEVSQDGRFDERDEFLLHGLALGRSQADLAQAAGCSERTVRRRAAEQDFRTELRTRRRAMAEHSNALLLCTLERAIQTLLELLGSPHDATRLRAAQVIVDRAQRNWHEEEIVNRLEALEAAAERAERQ